MNIEGARALNWTSVNERTPRTNVIGMEISTQRLGLIELEKDLRF